MVSVCSKFLPVAAALIHENGRLFVAQRPSNKRFGLKWEFPGGKVEEGESFQECLAREIREELCWDVRVGDLFSRIRHEDPQLRIELHAFWCTVCGGALRLREHVDFRWANPAELRMLDLTLPDLDLLALLERVAIPAGTHENPRLD